MRDHQLRSIGVVVEILRADQPLQGVDDLLLLMLERPRALVSRDEIRKRLWNEDVFVDVDASIRPSSRSDRFSATRARHRGSWRPSLAKATDSSPMATN